MTRPPDRLPQSVNDRQLRQAIIGGDTSSAGGRTGYARPVKSNAGAVSRQAPPIVSANPEGFFSASAPVFDPTVNIDTVGSGTTAGYFTAPSVGTPGVKVLQDGQYQALGTAQISGATPGDVFQMDLYPGTFALGFAGHSYGVARADGTCYLTCPTIATDIAGGLGVIQVGVAQIVGAGASLDQVIVTVVKTA